MKIPFVWLQKFINYRPQNSLGNIIIGLLLGIKFVENGSVEFLLIICLLDEITIQIKLD